MIHKNRIKPAAGIAFILVLIGLVYTAAWAMDSYIGIRAQEKWEEEDEEEEIICLNGHYYRLGYKVTSYLIMGTDASGNEEAHGQAYQGSMADFLLLVVIDDEKKTYGFLQINRDTMTNVTMLQKDGTGYASADMQICTAHWYGKDKKAGCKNTVAAVSELLGGIEISGYYALPMETVPMLNSVVDGVTLTISEDFTKTDPAMEKGVTLTLTDEQAYAYVRGRMGIGDGENTSRMQRQKQYMGVFFEKLLEKGSDDPQFAVQAYEYLADYATSDVNMKYISTLIKQIGTYENLGFLVPDGTTGVGDALGDGIEHTEFYIEEEDLEEKVRLLFPLEEAAPKDLEEWDDESGD